MLIIMEFGRYNTPRGAAAAAAAAVVVVVLSTTPPNLAATFNFLEKQGHDAPRPENANPMLNRLRTTISAPN